MSIEDLSKASADKKIFVGSLDENRLTEDNINVL